MQQPIITLVEEDKMDCKIVNGTVVTATDTYRGEVGITDGKVVQIAKKIKGVAEKVVDAKGCYVMPGGIDIHTHLDMPFGGTVSSDDFETGTIAAAGSRSGGNGAGHRHGTDGSNPHLYRSFVLQRGSEQSKGCQGFRVPGLCRDLSPVFTEIL
jgi:hypothetical protein